MKLVDVREAVGHVLVHDVTEVTKAPDRKHSAFRRGHVVAEQDIARLLDMGKRHLYVSDLDPGRVHENDGAVRLARAVARDGVLLGDPREGRVNLTAASRGLVVVDVDRLTELNGLAEVICVTRRTYSPAQAGETVAAVRVMPLSIDEATLVQAESIAAAHGGLVAVKSSRPYRVGLVVTGSEVSSGRIEDAFGPAIEAKMTQVGSEVVAKSLAGDAPADIERAIRRHLAAGCDMIVVTGGMSIDPDDRTPGAIRVVADRVVFQGAPVLPGCMTMLAVVDSAETGREVPLIGVPACGMHHDRTMLDLILARLVAGEFPTSDEVKRWGHGALCLECDECRFPNCTFGSV